MSITYEEALSTLTSMFGPPWTQETLDAVLRHYEGHMENTVEAVLKHGDGDPQVLVDRLKSGKSSNSVSADEELARQLANEEEQRNNVPRRSPTSPARPKEKKGRGTPTELPADFLRIPGQSAVDADERLARMLQDELFSKELANNPEFAHLSRGRGRPRTVGGRPVSSPGGTRRTSASNSHRRGADGEEGPHIMEKLSEMGENAKKRLGMLAAQWNNNISARRNSNAAAAGGQGGGGFASERRGLLDGDGDEDAFMNPHEMEMSSSPMGFGSKKNI